MSMYAYNLLDLLSEGSPALEIDEQGKLIPINLNIGDIPNGNYLQIRADGTLRLYAYSKNEDLV